GWRRVAARRGGDRAAGAGARRPRKAPRPLGLGEDGEPPAAARDEEDGLADLACLRREHRARRRDDRVAVEGAARERDEGRAGAVAAAVLALDEAPAPERGEQAVRARLRQAEAARDLADAARPRLARPPERPLP